LLSDFNKEVSTLYERCEQKIRFYHW
jgi:hypothetical protein